MQAPPDRQPPPRHLERRLLLESMLEVLMCPTLEYRSPDTFARIRSLLTTLQLRIDLYGKEHGSDEKDAAFLEAIHQDIARLADIVQEKRQIPRTAPDGICQDPSNYLARSS